MLSSSTCHSLYGTLPTEIPAGGLLNECCGFAFRHELGRAEPIAGGYELVFSDPSGEEVRLTTPRVVNAAGLDADRVAGLPGLDPETAGYRQIWTKGSYFRIRSAHRPLARRLLYPVHPVGFGSVLGIHLTVDLDGEMKLGPDAVSYTHLTLPTSDLV